MRRAGADRIELDAKTRLRELDVRLDPGRTIAVRVTDADDEPVADAKVIALAAPAR